VLASQLDIDNTVTVVAWAKPGERSAKIQLQDFLSNRLKSYKDDRNDPTKPKVVTQIKEIFTRALSIDAYRKSPNKQQSRILLPTLLYHIPVGTP
jgi:hypothetical protein